MGVDWFSVPRPFSRLILIYDEFVRFGYSALLKPCHLIWDKALHISGPTTSVSEYLAQQENEEWPTNVKLQLTSGKAKPTYIYCAGNQSLQLNSIWSIMSLFYAFIVHIYLLPLYVETNLFFHILQFMFIVKFREVAIILVLHSYNFVMSKIAPKKIKNGKNNKISASHVKNPEQWTISTEMVKMCHF